MSEAPVLTLALAGTTAENLALIAGRLRDGVDVSVAAAALDTLAAGLVAEAAAAEADSPASRAERYARERRHRAETLDFVRAKTIELAAAGSPLVTTFAYDTALSDPAAPVLAASVEVRWCDFAPSGPRPVEHDHAFSSVGRCMWPGCRSTAE